ncbi:hypothetical protein TNIN_444501 [Trichonephila inaurata madagascariensis]|uniref:Uncharacterized protein n=1 Tax=Trichonephila inaurata madagascariensis TaxID=2747483 RepID=A0A8X6XB29_9ARAC|nr:hypothetical protein TNIN_444501 [Trichonephila inaurata madagascariensis]
MHTENSISDEYSDAGENETIFECASAGEYPQISFLSRQHQLFVLPLEHKELSAVSVDISHKRDKRRLAQSEKKNSSDWKKKRISNKLAKSSKNYKEH